MNKISLFIFVFICFLGFSQNNVYTLQKCIELGMKNNLDLKVNYLQTLETEFKTKSIYENWLPSINLYSNHFYTLGSTIDPQTNTRVSANFQNDNGGLYSSINIFDYNGIQQVRKDKIDLEFAKKNSKSIEIQYQIKIIELYFECLFSQQNVKIIEIQLKNLSKNIDKIEQEVNLGNHSINDLKELIYQLNNEEIKLIEHLKEYHLKKSILFHFINENNSIENIELDEKTDFEPKIKMISQSELLHSKLKSNMIQQKMLKYNWIPQIQANYSFSSFYYTQLNSKIDKSNNYENQLNLNKNQQFGFQLNLPIYNANHNHRQIKSHQIQEQIIKTEIEKENKQFEQNKNELVQQISFLKQKEAAYQKMKQIGEENFKANTTKLELGIIDSSTFTFLKNQYESNLIDISKNELNLKLLELKLKYY